MALEPAGEADRSRDPPPQDELQDPGLSASAAVGSAAGGTRGTGARPAAALPARANRGLAAARAAPAEALAAVAIGAAALVLALLAGDGEAEFPGRGLEAAVSRHAGASSIGDAAQAAMDPEALARAALAGRLVEDPAFERRPPASERATQAPGDLLPAPGEAPAPQGDLGRDAEGDADADGDGDPVTVLSAASPPPADPALRTFERLRAQQPPPAALPAPQAAALRHGVAIQLLAVGRRDQAERAWDRLRHENPDLLGRLRPIIAEPEQRAGALFRLRAGPVASVEDGRALCAALSGRGIDCIVVQGG